jgi:hypothetical protein
MLVLHAHASNISSFCQCFEPAMVSNHCVSSSVNVYLISRLAGSHSNRTTSRDVAAPAVVAADVSYEVPAGCGCTDWKMH